MSHPHSGTPVLYEDRTLFPTPIPEDQRRPPPPPPKTGLSAAGVLMVAVFAAAVAAGVVFFFLRNTPPVDKPPVKETVTITPETNPDDIKTEDGLRKLLAMRQQENSQKEVEDLKAKVATLNTYEELASLETKIASSKAAVATQIKAAEDAKVPAKTLEEFKTMPEEPDLEWRLKQEDTLRNYVKELDAKAEDIRTRLRKIELDRARASGAAAADSKPCAGDVSNC